MKILIASDSHSRVGNLNKILKIHPNAEAVIFCGDGEGDIRRVMSEYPDMELIAVRGNCDGLSDLPLIATLEREGVRIAVLHGHTARAKYGDEGPINIAREGGYDIVLYGHTHTPRNDYISVEKPFYLFNPGAAKDGCFGLAVIKAGQILLSLGRL